MWLFPGLQRLKQIFSKSHQGEKSSSDLPQKQASSKAELDEIRRIMDEEADKPRPSHEPGR